MPDIIQNPWRGKGLEMDTPLPETDPARVQALLGKCPAHRETQLLTQPDIARDAGVAEVWIKDERDRMGLGSFKALGAAFAIAQDAADAHEGDWQTRLVGRTYVAASAGNHGLSVAAGARLFGAQAVIYLSDTVPEAFATRLESYGARVTRVGADYETSMAAAERDAAAHGWDLLSDSSWEGYIAPARRVMEGYLQMAAEAVAQIPAPPTHILLQAGVGGMAAAVAAHARDAWGDDPEIIVVEPAFAPALFEAIKTGNLVDTDGPVSCMGRLDCKTASLVALRGLSRDADRFVLLSEEEAGRGVARLASLGLETTPSGGAGLAALMAGLDLPTEARVLSILSEGPEDG